MPKEVRLALVGAGRWGKNIIATLESLPNAKLVAICSTTPDELAQYKTKYNTYADSRELVARNDIDGVLVVTPGSTHAKIALPFIQKGVPTYIEKPLTTTLADAKKIEKATQESGAQVFVGHLHLYNPAYHAAKEAISQAGPLRMLLFQGSNNGPYRDDLSAMWDWAPHDVYLTLDLVGEMPTKVQAWGVKSLLPDTNLYDLCVLKMTFASGLEAISMTSWLLPQKQKKMTAVAERDSIVFDDTAEKKVILYKGMGPEVAGDKVIKQDPEIIYPSYSSELALQQELKAFIEMIQTKKQPLSDLNEGIQVVKILAAAEESIRLDGQVVPL